MKRLSLALACVALSLAACAQDGSAPAVAAKPGAQATRTASSNEPPVAAGSPEARARDAIRKINPTIRIDQYNRQGIAVQYLAFPRMGLASEDFRKMVSVWCATDRKKALTDAKNDKPPAPKNCTNPVTMEYDLGRRVGLTGTPLILAADGTELGGYLPPDKLRAALDTLAAGKTVKKSGATDAAAGTGSANGAGGR